ncbi:MAG: M43 family zinc metalloprotease [Cryomorphaceae bacterium]|nr:T9SS type A sorting domain-containing protein [Flavobacteriales bacterium]
MRYTYLILFTAIFGGTAFSQNTEFQDPGHMTCGKNEATQAYFDANPAAALEAEIEKAAFMEERRNKKGSNRDTDYIVPVVFHIVHAGGNENISDEQVQSAIDVMNEDFNAGTPGISSVVSEFQSVVGDVSVEFRLARLDPDGNCTNGINRVFNTETGDGGENVKSGDAATWGRSSYLNIWVVDNIGGGTAGYAFLPWGAPVSGDGILIEDSYVGRIGTSNPNRSHALSHEVGHWAGLEHTWGSSGNPGQGSNCSDDDGISDTPNTIGWQTCDLAGNTCNSLDNVQNFMDYSYCYRMFTEGQSDLMRDVLESGPSGRPLLNSGANLEETGVLGPDVICFADFNSESDPIVCQGQSIVFNDISFNGVENREWTFEGGDPATSTATEPEVSFSTPGTYDVSLTVSNELGSESTTKTGFVTVLPSGENQIPFLEGFEEFENVEINEENWNVVNEGGGDFEEVKWELTSDAAYTGSQSVYVQGIANEDGARENLLSPSYDLSDVNDNAVFSFKYAHARRLGSSDDHLRVFISKDCGETWSLRSTLDDDDLPTVSGNVTSEFIPATQDDWTEVTITSIVSVFLNEEFRVRFEFESYRGNNIYIDDINIYDPATVGLDDVQFLERVKLYPNPTTTTANLEYTLKEAGNVRVEILDITGRVVSVEYAGNLPVGENFLELNTANLTPGIYLVTLRNDNEQVVRKLVKN